MATRELMGILLKSGDVILWGVPTPVQATVKRVHNSDPVSGKLRIETNCTPDIRVSCLTTFHVLIKEP